MPRGRRRKLPEHTETILSYFLRHRQAADTVEGVARWRLLEETVHRTVDETRLAMDWLVSEGFLVQESPASAQPVFRLNLERAAEADQLIASTVGDRAPTRAAKRRAS